MKEISDYKVRKIQAKHNRKRKNWDSGAKKRAKAFNQFSIATTTTKADKDSFRFFDEPKIKL